MFYRLFALLLQQAESVWRTVVKTGTGLIVANDTTEGQPVELQLQGWTRQDSTEGKNLFNISGYYSITKALIELDTIVFNQSLGNVTYVFDSFSSGSYTLSFMRDLYSSVAIYLNDSPVVSVGGSGSFSKNFDVNDGDIVKIEFKEGQNPNKENRLVYDIMLNEGSTALPYEPYTGNAPSPSPEYPQDIVNAGKYNEETGKYGVEVKLTGSNIFNKNGDYIEGTYVGFPIDNREEEVTVTLYEKDSSIDVTNVYFGVSENGVNQFEGLGWIIENGNVITKYKRTNFGYITFYPKSAVEKVLSRYDIMVNFGDKSLPYQEYMEQTVKVTSDRPITKWDRLVEKDGQIGWEYSGKEIIYDGSEDEIWKLTKTENYSQFWIENQEIIHSNSEKNVYCKYFLSSLISDRETKNNIIYTVKGVYGAVAINAETLASDVDGWKNWLKTNPIDVLVKITEPEFIPLPSEEQEYIRSLKTYYPTTVFSNNQEMFMQVEYKTKRKFGLKKPSDVTSMFDFGIRWSECNKIVLKASGMNTSTTNLLFSGGLNSAPTIYFNGSAIAIGNYLSDFSYSEINDSIFLEKYFELTFLFNASSFNNICNIINQQYSKQIIYHEIMFYNSDTLLADFIPDSGNSDRMYNTVNGQYITASELGAYELVEV